MKLHGEEIVFTSSFEIRMIDVKVEALVLKADGQRLGQGLLGQGSRGAWAQVRREAGEELWGSFQWNNRRYVHEIKELLICAVVLDLVCHCEI